MSSSEGENKAAETEAVETPADAPAQAPAQPLDSSGAPAAENFGFHHREGQASGEHVPLTPEEEAARKKRNIAIAWSLVAFMALVFAITVLRLGQFAANSGAAS